MTASDSRSIPALGEAAGGPASIALPVTDASQVGEARRRAMALGVAAGLTETEQGTLAVIVTEAATNLARHASDGILLLRAVDAPAPGVEVLAVDRGPGIRDLARAMADGYSTAGSAGHGLGAIRRMAGEFDLFSAPDTGTSLVARVYATNQSAGAEIDPGAAGVVCLPMGTERACGDAWFIDRRPGRTLVVLADGLGHGYDAARAADVAMQAARDHARRPPARIIDAAHAVMHDTRGAAIAVAEIVPAERRLTFAGIGNITATIVAPDSTKSLASLNGIVGHEMRSAREFVHAWPDNACLVVHSDGIRTRWQLGKYPGLAAHHPALLAGTLYRDFTRGRDDATVLVVRTRRL